MASPSRLDATPKPATVYYEPQLKCQGEEHACIQVFEFLTHGYRRDVAVTHTKAKWVVYLDGKAMAKERHSVWSIFTSKRMSLHFDIEVPETIPTRVLRGTVNMEWRSGGPCWQYDFQVNGTNVPAIWKRDAGVQKVVAPEVVGPRPVPLSDALAVRPAQATPLSVTAQVQPVPAPPPVDALSLLADKTTPEDAYTPGIETSKLHSMLQLALQTPAQLPQGPPVALEPTHVWFEVTSNNRGAVVRCCEPTMQPAEADNSRSMIVHQQSLLGA